jgi:hypothetical protein
VLIADIPHQATHVMRGPYDGAFAKSTVRYLGVDIQDALALAEGTKI